MNLAAIDCEYRALKTQYDREEFIDNLDAYQFVDFLDLLLEGLPQGHGYDKQLNMLYLQWSDIPSKLLTEVEIICKMRGLNCVMNYSERTIRLYLYPKLKNGCAEIGLTSDLY